MWLWWSALAWAGGPCATLERLPLSPPVPPARVRVAADSGAEKGLRDAYSVPNARLSPNFAVRWGDSGASVSEEQIGWVLDALEVSWEHLVVGMDHPEPFGAEEMRFNVYIGDTGDGAPGSYGAAGYYTGDSQGFPMIVIAQGTLRDQLSVEGTVSHEWYHALQGATARYPYEGLSAWYWEATAEWAALQVYPENPNAGGFLWAYLLMPELPVNFFDYPDSGALQEYYQYGAFLFPYDLTLQLDDPTLVRDSWVEWGENRDPLEVLRKGVAERGADLDVLWMDHLAASLLYDYPLGEQWRAQVSAYESYFPDLGRSIARYDGSGPEDWTEPDRAQLPRRYGFNAVEVDQPEGGFVHLRFDGEAEGSEGSPANFALRLVFDRGGQGEWIEVEPRSEWTVVPSPAQVDRLWLVVGAWTAEADPTRWETETFPYQYALVVADTEEPGVFEEAEELPSDWEPPPTQRVNGCGCASLAPGAAHGLAAGALAALVARRRRSLGGAKA